jgi:hypothetical protein
MILRSPEDTSRLDFELLRHSPVTLYRSREVLAEHLSWLRKHEYEVQEFETTAWIFEGDFHDAVAPALAFPSWYGRNLAAFSDCLCAAKVPEAGGLVLAFLSFHGMCHRQPELSWHILDIIAIWSRYFLLTGRRLMALVQTDDPALAIRPIGAQPVRLNHEEARRESLLKREAALRKVNAADDIER